MYFHVLLCTFVYTEPKWEYWVVLVLIEEVWVKFVTVSDQTAQCSFYCVSLL